MVALSAAGLWAAALSRAVQVRLPARLRVLRAVVLVEEGRAEGDPLEGGPSEDLVHSSIDVAACCARRDWTWLTCSGGLRVPRLIAAVLRPRSVLRFPGL